MYEHLKKGNSKNVFKTKMMKTHSNPIHSHLWKYNCIFNNLFVVTRQPTNQRSRKYKRNLQTYIVYNIEFCKARVKRNTLLGVCLSTRIMYHFDWW